MVNSASRTDSDVAGGAGREEMNGDMFRAGCVPIVSGVGAAWGYRCVRVSGMKGGTWVAKVVRESDEEMFSALVG